ncbi:DUF551 domain-containing protein [Klebsiella variicola]|uniref:DUF551 domain-containing protein n=1 Tax=Klebsiella variicola TaxID=244366 RepID=UPI002255AB04|nr:DUF551 domain-containing protein [Klebsiella variicola]
MKDHEIRELVNQLRDVAIKYHGTGQLREQIARTVRAAMLQSGNSPVIPDGYVLVPKEMTDEIGEAISMRARCCGGIALDIYDAMLAATSQPQNAQQNIPEIIPGWIPVSERVPEAGGDMIVFTDGIVMSGVSYAKKKGFYIQALEYDDDEPVDGVTHWMPLPAPPTEVK